MGCLASLAEKESIQAIVTEVDLRYCFRQVIQVTSTLSTSPDKVLSTILPGQEVTVEALILDRIRSNLRRYLPLGISLTRLNARQQAYWGRQLARAITAFVFDLPQQKIPYDQLPATDRFGLTIAPLTPKEEKRSENEVAAWVWERFQSFELVNQIEHIRTLIPEYTYNPE